jgi:hypothetical protein
MAGVVVLVGCAGLARIVERAGFRAHELDYFWASDAIEEDWVAAIVDSSVGGQTGLAVAERLRRRMIVPVVLFGREERERVLSRFLGVDRAKIGSQLGRVLELCVRETLALRIEEPPCDSTGVIVVQSMILAVDPLTRSERTPSSR